MCLILFALKVHPRFPLIVAANRDEFLARPTVPARFWPDHPSILAGRDMVSHGSWLGVSRTGRFAAVTNYRDLRIPQPINPPSRGGLVVSALEGVNDFPAIERYDGFNLLFGGAEALYYLNNVDERSREVMPGVHGLSNHLLDTPWPKVERGKQLFVHAIEQHTLDMEALFTLLQDERSASDDQLPDTGLDIERERALSSMFIATDGYGTRCSTVVLFDEHGGIRFEERTWHPHGVVQHTLTTEA